VRKLYTGPFGPMSRNVWTQKAKQWVEEGNSEQFLYILPTARLLKEVREDLLQLTGGMGDVKLLTFDEIAEQLVLAEDPRGEILTPYEFGRFYDQLIEQIENHSLLKPLTAHLHLKGVKRSLLHMLGEIKRSGITSEQMKTMLEQSGTSAKNKALAFLYIKADEWLDRLSERNGYTCMTRESRLQKAAQLLGDGKTLPHWLEKIQTIWVDQFTDFTPLQFQMLKGLISLQQVKQVGIYLPYQGEIYQTLPHFQPLIQSTIASLEELGIERVCFEGRSYPEIIEGIAEDWLTNEELVCTSPSIGLWKLRQQLFTRKQLPDLDQESLEIIPCTSIKQEVSIVGKLIKKALLKSPELKPSQIAVISRDLQSVQPTIQEVFGEQSLPLAIRSSLHLSDTPIARQLSALLQLELSGWHRDDLLKLYEGNYINWGVPVPLGLVRWIKQKGIVEGKKGWLQAVEADLEGLQQKLAQLPHDHTLLNEEKERLEAKWNRIIQSLQLLVAWFGQIDKLLTIFPKKGNMQEMLQAAKEWLMGCGIEKTMAKNIKNPNYDRQWLKRDMQSWSLLQHSLETLKSSATKMRELDRTLSFAGFIQEWMEHWNEVSVMVGFGDVEGISCFEPSAARGLQFKQVYIIGCNDGVFPISHRENWLLDDQERQLLEELGNLPASHHHNEMEQIFFLMAASLPEERLVCTMISPEANEKVLVSPFLEALEKILPDYHRRSVNDLGQLFKEIASQKDYALWLMQRGKEEWQGHSVALYRSDWLVRPLFQHVLEGVKIEHDRAFAGFTPWEGNLQQGEIQQLLKEKFSTQVKYSVSQINEYISSPLTFFFKRVLGVQPMDETGAEVSALDKGQILHEVLRKFFTNHLDNPLEMRHLPQYQLELCEILQEEATRFAKGTIHEDSPLWGFEVERMKGEMQAWLTQEIEGQGVCRPRFLELSFGLPLDQPDCIDAHSQMEEIIVPLGEELLRLYGKIDRIDVDEQGRFRILDYKLSLSRYGDYKELTDQTVTYQLPLYLAAMEEWLRAKGVEDPQMVGGGFYSLRKKEAFKKVGMWEEKFRDQAGIPKRARKGVFSSLSERIRFDLGEVKEQLEKLRAGDFFLTTRQKPNEYYADNAVFRYNPIYLRHKEKNRGRIEHAANHSN